MKAFRITHFAIAGIIGSSAISLHPTRAEEPKSSAASHTFRSGDYNEEILRTADWNEAHDLETFDSVCQDLTLPEDMGDDADAIVIDLDQLKDEPKEIPLGKGMRLRITRKDSRQLSLTLQSTHDSTAQRNRSCTEVELAELPLLPMPEMVESRRDDKVALFQVQYAQLMSEGKEAEAEQLASQFLADDQTGAASDVPRPLPLDLSDAEEPYIKHRVGYKGSTDTTRLVFPKDSSAPWSEVAKRKISCTLTGARVDDVAQFLRLATGMTIEVALPREMIQSVRFRVSLSDEPMKDALLAIAQSGGIQITPTGDRIVFQPVSP